MQAETPSIERPDMKKQLPSPYVAANNEVVGKQGFTAK